MENFKVICINDADRPDGIPLSKWIKKGDTYTVIEVSHMRMQGGKLGFKLAEIDLDSCFPYQYFSATRFAIPTDPNQKDQWAEEVLEKILKENPELV